MDTEPSLAVILTAMCRLIILHFQEEAGAVASGATGSEGLDVFRLHGIMPVERLSVSSGF